MWDLGANSYTCAAICEWMVAWGGRKRSQGMGKAGNIGHGRGMT